MRFLKSLLRGLASLGFKFGLMLLAVTTAAIVVFGTSSPLKKALSGSQIYDHIIDNLVTTSKDSHNGSGSGSTTSLDELPVKQAAKTAFSPAFLQSSTEQVIDSVYLWLRGTIQKPNFRIDLSEPKHQFAVAAADNAVARARTLPACTLQQTRELARQDIDPFHISCVPPGTDINLIRNKVISDLDNNQDFIKDPVITADNLAKDNQGKTIFDKLNHAPKIFHWFLLAPWVIGGVTLLSGAILLLLHDEKRRGLRAMGGVLLGSGVFLLISTWILNYAFNQVNKPGGRLGKLAKNDLQNNLLAVIHSLTRVLSNKLFMFGIVYACIGAVVLLILRLTRPKIKYLKEEAGSQPEPTDPPLEPDNMISEPHEQSETKT